MKKLIFLTGMMMIATTAMATNESFNIRVSLIRPIEITEISELNFGEQFVTGSDYSVTVAPADSGAATFSATGKKNRSVSIALVSNTAVLSDGTDNINVTGLTLNKATDTFSNANPGVISNIRVGGTVTIPAAAVDRDLDYVGTGTLRILYN